MQNKIIYSLKLGYSFASLFVAPSNFLFVLAEPLFLRSGASGGCCEVSFSSDDTVITPSLINDVPVIVLDPDGVYEILHLRGP